MHATCVLHVASNCISLSEVLIAYPVFTKLKWKKHMNDYADLDALSLRELKALKRRIEVAIETRDERLKRTKAAEKIKALAKNMGYSVEELLEQPRLRRYSKVAPKYRNPANSMQTWSGRGRQPIWLRDLVAKGANADDFRIKE